MKVYLDNNVFADIEDGEYQVEDFLSIPDVEYYYSDAHISELLEAKGNSKVSQEDRLKLISRVCGQNYILTGVDDQPEFIQKDVRDMYSVVDRTIRVVINAMAQDGVEIFERIRVELGFESCKFNNESYVNVLRTIDKRMSERLGLGLKEYLYRSEARGGKPLYYSLLNIIDTANYWGDKKTEHSEIARVYDASRPTPIWLPFVMC